MSSIRLFDAERANLGPRRRHILRVAVVLCAVALVGCSTSVQSPSASVPTPALTASSGTTPSPQPTPSPSPTASPNPSLAAGQWLSGGLIWKSVPLPGQLMHGIIAVPNGLVGVCDPSGEEVGQACTSRDGISWSLTPDPAIFVKEGNAPFRPRFAVRGPGGWVATDNGFAGWIDQPAEYASIWRSTDGIHWQLAPKSASLKGLTGGALYVVGGDFLLAGQANGRYVLLRSSDGLAWAPVPAGAVEPICADQNGLAFFGAAFSAGQRTGSPNLFSADGRTWKPIQRPDPLDDLVDLAALPDGTLLATAWDGRAQRSVMLQSADGASWQMMSPTPVAMDNIAVFGGRLLGTANDSSGNGVTWESSNDGRTWQPLQMADGSPMGAARFVVAGKLLLMSSGGAQFFIGSVGRAP